MRIRIRTLHIMDFRLVLVSSPKCFLLQLNLLSVVGVNTHFVFYVQRPHTVTFVDIIFGKSEINYIIPGPYN